MKFRLLPVALVVILLGCSNSDGEYSDREAAYNRSLECYQEREDSEDCNSAYRALIEIERDSISSGSVGAYKEKYCSGLSMDELLCEVGKAITLTVEQEEADRADSRVEYYLSNRSELQKKYNECGKAYYEEAGLVRDGTWIGASGSSKLFNAKKTFDDDFNWECEAAAEAANKLNIEFSDYFVKNL